MPRDSDTEEQLSLLLSLYAGPRAWELRHPWVVLRAARLLRRLPVSTFRSSGSIEGELIAGRLKRSHFGISSILHEASAVLRVSDSGDAWLGNKSARKHARRAVRAGVEWTHVIDPEQKAHLLELAQEVLRPRLVEYHGTDEINIENMLQSALWLAAWLDGQPLVVSVTAIDGEWSMLRLFSNLQATRTSSSARYLLTQVLVEELARRGVRYACDSASPFRLPPGLRHFARMVGFRIQRVRVT